ncbi:hypothetical protein K438DRAFT_1786167 [Mycena galopus ATCC 62051]|nr:hypothetical protein K438DRAFT_1786167 [Mycena galopus ATCC 62051]
MSEVLQQRDLVNGQLAPKLDCHQRCSDIPWPGTEQLVTVKIRELVLRESLHGSRPSFSRIRSTLQWNGDIFSGNTGRVDQATRTVMNDTRPPLIVLLLGDPQLLESSEGRENRPAEPDGAANTGTGVGIGIGIDMDDPNDPERFWRGSPWTPAVMRTESYAFGAPGEAASSAHASSPSPLPFTPSSSPLGRNRDDKDDGDGVRKPSPVGAAHTRHAKAAYIALVRVLRWKAVVGRARGECVLNANARGSFVDTLDRDRVGVYRRDVGDTMVNVYYILRDDLLVYLVDEAARGGAWAWEYTKTPIQYTDDRGPVVPLDGAMAGGAALARPFGPEVWGRLPAGRGGITGMGTGKTIWRVRRWRGCGGPRWGSLIVIEHPQIIMSKICVYDYTVLFQPPDHGHSLKRTENEMIAPFKMWSDVLLKDKPEN